MKTREQLIADCQGLVRSLAWQIHCKLPPHVDLDDLIAYGQIGLIEAAQAFDPTRENQFSTYSYFRIRGAIFDGLSKMTWFNRASFNSGAYERQREVPATQSVIPRETTQPETRQRETIQPETEKTPEQLVANCQGLVRSLAWQIHCKLPEHVQLAAIVAYGQKGLVEAARQFVPSSPNQFSTYCYQYIQDAIFKGLSQEGWFNRADYHGGVYERRAAIESEAELVQSHEFSKSGDQPAKEARGVAGLVSIICHGFQGATAGGLDAGECEEPTPLDAVMQREMVEKLRELIDDLPERAKTLILATYFEGLTLKDAGKRLGMSKAWASRLHAKTLRQLGQSFRVSRMVD